ncbi:high affinity iron permease FTR1 [Rhodopseudomonas palustris]|uniref:FTR1 family iron permease n=1 Tax=Rhodopseudomonas palustris TaxID=1076 RepID=UPI000D1AE0D6|nr:FTR1 family protein [Rhodopseudomonas palustris]AVT75677.1 high affinity iron permease FTR1 [Rhodopseudomonas palustris]
MIGSQFGNVVIVVWREGVEALLIVGILNAWLRNNDASGIGRRYLWSGAATGLLLAIGFGTTIALSSSTIPVTSREVYEAIATLLAAGLIVHMVTWMRGQGRLLRDELEAALRQETSTASWWGVFTLAALAIAREGAETILFLLGALSAVESTSPAEPILGGIVGVGLALATYALLQLGSRIATWRLFFRVTEVMMLLLAASLLISGVDTLSRLGMLPLTGRLWDSSSLLSDHGAVGALVAGLTGYRSQPNLLELGFYVVYWICVVLLLRKTAPPEQLVVAENRAEVQR